MYRIIAGLYSIIILSSLNADIQNKVSPRPPVAFSGNCTASGLKQTNYEILAVSYDIFGESNTIYEVDIQVFGFDEENDEWSGKTFNLMITTDENGRASATPTFSTETDGLPWTDTMWVVYIIVREWPLGTVWDEQTLQVTPQ